MKSDMIFMWLRRSPLIQPPGQVGETVFLQCAVLLDVTWVLFFGDFFLGGSWIGI